VFQAPAEVFDIDEAGQSLNCTVQGSSNIENETSHSVQHQTRSPIEKPIPQSPQKSIQIHALLVLSEAFTICEQKEGSKHFSDETCLSSEQALTSFSPDNEERLQAKHLFLVLESEDLVWRRAAASAVSKEFPWQIRGRASTAPKRVHSL